MELFDTHFHYDGEISVEEYMAKTGADLQLSAKVFTCPVEKLYLLCAGGSWSGSKRAMEFAEKVENCYFSAGVHPHDAEEYRQQGGDFSVFRSHPKLRAVGEIGLDYFYGLSERNIQLEVLQEFLDLALAWNLPAMLHLRDKDDSDAAYADALKMLEKFSKDGGRFLIHCYAGNLEYAEKFLELGGYFGVTGLYTFKAADNIRSVITRIPAERLLIETDSPYLAPVPFRGKPNHPALVAVVAEYIADFLQEDRQKLADETTANALRAFELGE